MSAKTSRRRSTSGKLLLEAIQELSNRPAMNGGFKKLAEQQEEQLERIQRVESDVAAVKKFAKWIGGVLTGVLVAVLIELATRALAHVQFVH